MRRWVLLLLCAGALADGPAPRVGDPALQHRIGQAIRRGAGYLKSIQRSDGSWAMESAWWLRSRQYAGGLSALCLYALASCDIARDDDAIVRGLEFLRTHPEEFAADAEFATYANSLLLLALARIDVRAHREAIHAAAQRLVAGQLPDGMWAYRLEVRTTADASVRDADWGGGAADNSNTQFAVLALWAAQAMADFRVPRRTWERVRDHFVGTQRGDGGWYYRSPHRRSGLGSESAMTAAGVVSLAYSLSALAGDPSPAAAREHASVKRGLACLSLDMIDPMLKSKYPPKRVGLLVDYYWAYSLERAGAVLLLDPESWYAPGARCLLECQSPAGRWPDGREAVDGGYPYETSLALLFLTGATRATVTRREAGVDSSTPEGLARAFDLYVASNAERRAALLPDLARLDTIRLCIAKLRDDRQPVREAAFELLTRLVDRPFLFDPAAGLEEREVMLGPIEAFWAERGERLEWDQDRSRFVPR